MMAWKLGPALATGNMIVLKPSEFTPFTALGMAPLIIVNRYGSDAGTAIAAHPLIEKKVTLELGGKSPNIIFADADITQAVKWVAHGVLYPCCAGTRIFVHEKIYDDFLEKFMAKAPTIKIGDPFGVDTYQGPQVSQLQFDDATLQNGGERHGEEGYFIQPTIFTDTHTEMKIVRKEIFGQVGESGRRMTRSTGSKNIDQALRVAHKLHAGAAWVNCANTLDTQVPFGGYKQSGIGRELGEYALAK
ncbi:Aldehyde/histidinol dehydrogenase [Phellopilus nigrolimitatus]|nr:Aldehyde/histidinol dehydrogenase [Phellopilus nigrolimitatus]